MSKLAEQIESARREYVAAIGTEHEAYKRRILEWLVSAAKREHRHVGGVL